MLLSPLPHFQSFSIIYPSFLTFNPDEFTWNLIFQNLSFYPNSFWVAYILKSIKKKRGERERESQGTQCQSVPGVNKELYEFPQSLFSNNTFQENAMLRETAKVKPKTSEAIWNAFIYVIKCM